MDWDLRLRIMNNKEKEVFKVARWSKIPVELIGQEVEVHNGRRYVRVKVREEMVGFRFGEFVTTTAWSTKEISKQPVIKRKGKTK